MSDSALKSGDTATVSIQFSEEVISFSNSNMTVPNGTLSTLTSSDNINWSAVYTPNTNVEDATNVLTINNSYTDLAGNNGSSLSTSNFTIDTKAPTASISYSSIAPYKENDVVTITATFNEDNG